MKSTKFVSFAFVALSTMFFCTNIDAALNAYMSVTGQKQGLIKGGVTQKGREGKIMVIAANHEVVSPRDAASGAPTGKVQHRPFEVTIEWDQAMTKLYSALLTQEPLPSVEIDFYGQSSLGQAGGAGAEVNHTTIKLTNATISSIRSRMLNNKNPELTRFKEYMEVSFVYQKIDITTKLGGATVSGNWAGKELQALADGNSWINSENRARTALQLH